ncbi:MAG: hypothetical protein SPF89_00960 [Sphaerochaetaceae bacterium]|nr:hypothetical protein [Spirochaetales bacterium]MDY5498653.1 hypothetical protein [Sphaerochaetaceae bacterium]
MREQMAFMDSDVRQMRAILKKYAPLEMLKLACWDRWRVTSEGDAQAACTASAFVRFLQNAYVLQQTYDTEAIHSERDIHTKDYKRLVQLFDDLVKRTQRYVDNMVLAAKAHSGVRENGIVEQMQIFASDRCFPPPQNERSIPDRSRLLRMSLLPFQGAIDQAFHAGLDGIVEAFASLEAGCMQSLRDLRKDTDDYKRDMDAKIKESKELGQEFSDDQERVDAIVNREHWHERIDSMLSRRDGYDLYDVQKLTKLDGHDCEALSLALASVEGIFSQYPFETRATVDYPFVHGVTKYFCFDADHLLDDGYQIIKDHVINEGLLSSEEWEATEKESRLLQPVTIVHSLFGSMSFELRKDGYDAVFDFPERHVGLVVVNPVETDPFEDGRGCMLEIANDLTRMGWVRNQRIRAIVVDGTLVGNYPLQLQDGVLYVTASQFLRITQEPETIKQCKDLLGLALSAEPCEDLPGKQEEPHDGSETIGSEEPAGDMPEPEQEKKSVPVPLDTLPQDIDSGSSPLVPSGEKQEEPRQEEDASPEPDADASETEDDSEDEEVARSLAEEDDEEPEPDDEEHGQEEEDEDLSEEAEEDVAESMIHDSETSDDDVADVPTEESDAEEEDEDHVAQIMAKEVQDETSSAPVKPQFSLFSLLNDISKGNDHPSYAPARQESSNPIPDTEPVHASGQEAELVSSQVSSGSLSQDIANGASTPSAEKQEESQPEESAEPAPAEEAKPEAEPGREEQQEKPEEAEPASTPFSFASLLQGIANGPSAEKHEEPQEEKEVEPVPAPRQEEKPALAQESLASSEEEELQPEAYAGPAPVEKTEPEVGTGQAAPVVAEAGDEDAGTDAPLLEDLVSASPIDVALGGKQIPARLREILEKQGMPDGAFFTMCKEGSDKLLDASSALIDKALMAQSQDGKDKMFTISKYALTFVIASRSDDELSRYDRKENIGAMMYVDGKDSWNSITLFYDKGGELRGVDTQTIRQADYTQLEWKYATNIGERIIARRKQQKG